MTAFISHSFENKPEFENVTDALELKGVAYWSPAEIRSGASLREQLRAAVEKCSLCIFIASRKSIDSSWCGAELGAFWGARKPIVVYLAEASLTDDELPQIVQGDVWERRISKIADRAKEIESLPPMSDVSAKRDASVAQLTVEQLEKMIVGAVSLAAATAKDKATSANFDEVGVAVKNAAGKVLAGFKASELSARDILDDWHSQILWVDDRPDNNTYERQAMEAMGLTFTLAVSTDEALQFLSTQKFAAIISDMGRNEGPREGYKLLELLRAQDKSTPFFIYAGSNAPSHRREASLRGAQGSTNIAETLIEMVTRSLPAGA
ncbi:MAG: TIR domain-containing protein [Microbacteriaceae bacterium]|nr:TIR domain-containing protein [Burkholderiaceae bacterium]